MAKIVLDTNILARAVTSPSGLAAEILCRCMEYGNVLCTSSFMLAELDRVLRYPRLQKIHGLTDSQIQDFVRSIQQVALVINVDPAMAAIVTRDIDDDPVVETAVRAKADFLCSADRDIHTLPVIEHCRSFGIKVVSDLQMIAILRESSPN